jgi:GDP-L-fucose synthase
LFLLENYDDEVAINVGVGEDITIREVAELIKKIVGYSGSIDWDTSKPDGTPRKLLDVSRINELGWFAEISLEQGISESYLWYSNSSSPRS